mgnify:CR=1 FL=1
MVLNLMIPQIGGVRVISQSAKPVILWECATNCVYGINAQRLGILVPNSPVNKSAKYAMIIVDKRVCPGTDSTYYKDYT